MAFAPASDPLLRFAFWVGIAALTLSILLLVSVVLLRLLLLLRQAQARTVIARYRPLLLQATQEKTASLPMLSLDEARVVLRLWVDLHETVRGPAKDRMNAFGRASGFDRGALWLLTRRNARDRLLGIAVAGLLRDLAAWDFLQPLVESPVAPISIAAARALLQINPVAALPRVIATVGDRTDWPEARVAALLIELGPDAFSQSLAAAARASHAAGRMTRLKRLLHLLEFAHIGDAEAIAREIAAGSNVPGVIAACLKLLRSPEDRALVQRFVRHPASEVRVQVAHALARMGIDADRPVLMELLGDRNWWVRYRAAQALASLPSVGVDGLKTLCNSVADRFAADMLRQVIAEKEAG